jgi:hypothetical protein
MVSTKMLLSSIFFLGLLANAPVQAFSFEYDPEFVEVLKEFKIACQMMNEQIAKQEISSERRIFRKPKLIFADEYNKQVFECYKERLDNLWSKLIYNAIGDGFLLGLLAGAIQPVHGMKSSKSRVQFGLLANIWLMTTLQDYQIKNLSYYDKHTLKPKTGLFKWWRMYVAFMAAKMTWASVDAIVSRRCL